MKLLKLQFVSLTLLLIAVSAFAQQPAAAPPKPAPGPALLPKGKVAVINTQIFQEQVEEFKAKVDQLNRQFEPRVKEVQSLADKINALETTIKSQSGVLTPARVAEMTENLESMKREYQRKGEDLQAEAGRTRDKAFEPITGKLTKFAEDYTAKRGIVMLVDISNAVQSGTVLWYDPRTDVTQDFVNAYNKANPMTTAPAAKPPAKP
ncbi:MAG TPA: OmpH family outer membrane protein [Blastocatellia bacterium]|nr:OmpH family outer membrane protein [Blastocatellia bacterium]